ncbi:MATE efflux family protein, putative [Theobroma cacao]|uniref:MATE efflux family protein, putative n=1 Tax=Theobroma cacao TaxID=3641 RepID=A0A061EQW3_THECC|nr:MATE efflux family protein, putative [Theobroma cacao]
MATNPNLEVVSDVRREGNYQGRWWGKILDLREAREQISTALPLIVAYVFCYSMTMVSIMFAGHLGELELAGSSLANSWATVTGFGLMTELSGALETLCGQAFGARIYRQLGIYLQASCQISFLFSILIPVLRLFTKPILVLLRQDPEVATAAALYIKYLIPGRFAFGFEQNIMRYCQAQGITLHLVLFTGVPFGLHFALVYFLVNRTSMGFIGSPAAASISIWLSCLSLAMFVIFSKRFENTWKGLSLESFGNILKILRLAIPSAANGVVIFRR